ncbi:MAG TPA: DinB family protein [Bacteroidota bacterium]|nr:DinB family protein [Bacteroidota bacterium]
MKETAQEYTARILGYQEGTDPLKILRSTPGKIERLLRTAPRRKLMSRPEPSRWSVAEIVAHLADTELVGGFRMRMIIGDNGTTIQAFDQDVWAEKFEYARRDPKKSLDRYRALRENNLALITSIPKSLWQNYGMHAERGKETVERIIQMYAGHDLNHLRQIEKILRHK